MPLSRISKTCLLGRWPLRGGAETPGDGLVIGMIRALRIPTGKSIHC
jgi:hypothetical protein